MSKHEPIYPLPWADYAEPSEAVYDADDDPISLFSQWLNEAWAVEPSDANAMALATSDRSGRPSVRTVLLKGHGACGFVFYTNLKSRKAEELTQNPKAALLFHWKLLGRQVRIEGDVAPVGDQEADIYFASRDRLSQIGAWSSEQSRPLRSRSSLEARVRNFESLYAGLLVPRPPHWSGFCLMPERIEFWSDRPHRLHDRRLFTRSDGAWASQLLCP